MSQKGIAAERRLVPMPSVDYERIGVGYGEVRRADPRIAARQSSLRRPKSTLRELDVGLRLVIAELNERHSL